MSAPPSAFAESSLRLRGIGAVLCASLSFPALAQVDQVRKPTFFSCKDSKGRTLTSDRPIPECAGAVRELREDGAMRREVPAPLTAEQVRLKELEDARAEVEALRKREQQLRDKALLMAYTSLASLEATRKRRVHELYEEISQAQSRIELIYPDLQTALYEMKARNTSVTRARVSAVAQAILSEDDLIRSNVEAIARLREKFDQDAKRLRELLGS